jgi:hypothetical protein
MNDTIFARFANLNHFLPLVLFIGTLLFTVTTSRDYGVTWDEPPYFHASDLHVQWIRGFADNIASGQPRKSLDDGTIKAAWHWNPYNVPHPPFSRIVSGVGQILSRQYIDKFSAYRIGPALFFALLVTVMFLWAKELFGTATGLFSALAVIVIPNLFGYAHIAVTDLPLASLWFLTVYCFWKGLSDWKWSVMLGAIWGLALATKFPALLIPVPLILWAHLFHRDKYGNNVFALLFIGPIFMIGIQPYLWHQTGLRILEFLYEGLSRAYRPDANFTIHFFHQLYFTSELPWYYPFFVVAVTTPEPILLLALVGILSLIRVRQHAPVVLMLLLNLVFVLVLGLMPGAVLHDGLRQILSALPFLAALAAVGYYLLLTWIINLVRHRIGPVSIPKIETKLAVLVVLLCGFSPLIDLYLSHPFQLSFYNRFVGGIRGAYVSGLETTYFMEAFTPDFLKTFNEKMPQNATVNAFVANNIFEFYQKESRLRGDIRITGEQNPDYYVILHRRSTLKALERTLIDRDKRPVLRVDIAGVPLVSVFKNLDKP